MFVLLCGCTQVLGLDEPTAVTGRYVARAIRNDSSLAPLAELVTRPDTLVVRTLEPPETLEPDSNGRFAFLVPRRGELVRLVVTRDNQTTEFQLATADIDLAVPMYGRPERAKVTPMTSLGYMISNATGASAFTQVATTGIWAQAVKPSAEPNTNFTIDWSSASPLSRPIGMLDGTAGDRAYFLLFDRFPPTGTATYYSLTRFREDTVTLAAGATININTTAMNVPSSTCVHVRAPLVAESARLAAAGLTVPMMATRYWEIAAQPAPMLGPEGFMVSRAYNTQLTADVDAQIMVANPFPSHALALRMVVIAAQDILAPGATSALIASASTNHWSAVGDGCSSPTTVTPSIALLGDARLAGAGPGSVTLDRSTDPVLAWTVKSGAADRYTVNVMEVTAVPDTCTTNTVLGPVLATYITTAPSILVDQTKLVAGKHYVFQITSDLGLPNAAKGDLFTATLPYARSTVYSGVFTMAN